MKQLIKAVFPATIFNVIRDTPYFFVDCYNHFFEPARESIPPTRLMVDGPRDRDIFVQNGLEALTFYRDVLGMQTSAKILDMGCGIGRKTVPLLKHLDSNALYVGVDIDRRGVEWCSRNISKFNPHFIFFALDIYNKFYNPRGAIRPHDLVLPFPDNSFDYVVLWSVFTHMYPRDISRYLSEISRVLRKDGKCVASFFIMNGFSRSMILEGKTKEKIIHRLEDCWTSNRNIPEDLIAMEEEWLRKKYEELNFHLDDDIYFGKWSGHNVDPRLEGLNSQDIIVARKLR